MSASPSSSTSRDPRQDPSRRPSKDGHDDDGDEKSDTTCHDVIRPASYIIFDTETTGLPGANGNPKITELCLMAIGRDDMYEDGVDVPRVVNTLRLCVNPKKRVSPGSSRITGLFNDSLQRQQPFNEETISLIRDFIQLQCQPCCLIAHNGDKFDFPLLQSELSNKNQLLPDSVLCADSLLALRELDAAQEIPETGNGPTQVEVTPIKRPASEYTEPVVPQRPRKNPYLSELPIAKKKLEKIVKKLSYDKGGKDDLSEGKKSTVCTNNSVTESHVDTNLKTDTSTILETSTAYELQSEDTVTYSYKPVIKASGACEMNSQGSVPDEDFLAAIQGLEAENEIETKVFSKESVRKETPPGTGEDSVGGMIQCNQRSKETKHQRTESCHPGNDFSTTTSNQQSKESGQIRTGSSFHADGLNVIKVNQQTRWNEQSSGQRECEVKTGYTISRDNSIPKVPQRSHVSPNGVRRRSFRLPDVYMRVFGNPPLMSHTAEDDCVTLLKVVKRFSPGFLYWVDEHCVPFNSVKPMY